MEKEFSKNNPLDKLSGITKNNEMIKNVNEEHNNESKDQVKKKPGRPKTKTEKTKTINIAVPVSVLEKIDIAKVCYGNNLTCYINRLIEKDIEANYEEYKNIIIVKYTTRKQKARDEILLCLHNLNLKLYIQSQKKYFSD